tara:strand:+ start:359 stop:460 length:102 start_codon:yes stop_codon:yes gene_type:complete
VHANKDWFRAKGAVGCMKIIEKTSNIAEINMAR